MSDTVALDFCMWSSHAIFSSIIIPDNFTEDIFLIELLAILRSGSFNGMLPVTHFLWNKVYFAFFTFKVGISPSKDLLIASMEGF